MCGRITLDIDILELKKILEAAFGVTQMSLDHYAKRYNIAPTQSVVALIGDGQTHRAGHLSWQPPINYRSEALFDKKTMPKVTELRPCIIIASSFFEWHKATKQPYRIQIKDQPVMPLAGLWQSIEKPSGQKQYQCTILTTQANEKIKLIHSRMPVILNHNDIGKWLTPSLSEPTLMREMLQPYAYQQMSMYPVSTLVNSTKFDSPECIANINTNRHEDASDRGERI